MLVNNRSAPLACNSGGPQPSFSSSSTFDPLEREYVERARDIGLSLRHWRVPPRHFGLDRRDDDLEHLSVFFVPDLFSATLVAPCLLDLRHTAYGSRGSNHSLDGDGTEVASTRSSGTPVST